MIPKSGYYANGFRAYQCGRSYKTNPHTPGTVAYQDWVEGFERAFIEDVPYPSAGYKDRQKEGK